MSNHPWCPTNIKASVLTDVLNWKTSEKSYEDLCKRFGENAISKYDHQELFNTCTRQNWYLLEAQTNINEIVFNESMYLRYRILQFVISRYPIVESYEALRSVMEDISYPEFEFWYYLFYNGQRDLDYDRSKDPKPLTFSDLPTDVIEKIVQDLDIRPRYILRGVSRDLRSLVDSSILRIGKITIIANIRSININMDGAKKTLYCPASAWFTDPGVTKQNAINVVSSRLAIFIKNPKLQLESLDIQLNYDFEWNKRLTELLKSLPHQLHVNNLRITVNRHNELINYIHCMKPKVLKKLEITASPQLSIFHEITDSEQWKQAEEVYLYNTVYSGISHFFHFKRFDIFLIMDSMEVMLELRDGISKSSNFEWCKIGINRSLSEEKIQGSLELKKHVHNNMEYFVYNIPNSTETLVFSFSSRYSHDLKIFIEKSTRSAGF